MANGNHEENGIWALFVIAAIIIINRSIKFNFFKSIKFKDPNFIINLINIKIMISPIRFIKIVTILELNLFLFI